MSGPYKVGEFGPHLIKDWGVSGPAGSEHSEHWSRQDAIKMAVRLNNAHGVATKAERASLREKVEAMRARIVDPDPDRIEHWCLQDFVEAGHAKALDEVLALLGVETRP